MADKTSSDEADRRLIGGSVVAHRYELVMAEWEQ